MRIERDSMGTMEVPDDALWGAQTARAVANFPFGGGPMPPRFVRALALVKWAAAGANAGVGALDSEVAGAIRAAAHGDINTITLLLGAEEAGLQLKDADGEWLDIAPPPGALVVNIGDMLQRLTAGRLRSTTHRVVNPSGEAARRSRYSMPFFLHFRSDFLITALFEGGEPAITADPYLQERLREIKLA